MCHRGQAGHQLLPIDACAAAKTVAGSEVGTPPGTLCPYLQVGPLDGGLRPGGERLHRPEGLLAAERLHRGVCALNRHCEIDQRNQGSSARGTKATPGSTLAARETNERERSGSPFTLADVPRFMAYGVPSELHSDKLERRQPSSPLQLAGSLVYTVAV